jgi:hypothetical protein
MKKKRNKVVDIICVSLVALIFGSIALLNIIQKDRPTESVAENRKLAEMPEFSWQTLIDGSYFAGVASFISDTFIDRDNLVNASKELDTLKGYDYSIDGNDNFALLSPVETNADESEHAELTDKLNEAIDNLNNTETEAEIETERETEGTIVTGGEIVDETTPEEVTSAETETENNSEVNTDETSAETEDTADTAVETTSETQPKVTSINLSKTTLKLTVGSGSVIYATVDTDSENGATVKWSISDKNIATLSVNESGGINVKGVTPGKATLTCSYNDDIKETCQIEVTEITAVTQQQNDLHADFLASGLFIYGDAVYTQAWYSDSAAEVYAQTVAYYKKLFGDKTRVSVVVAPVSAMVVDNEEVRSKIEDQDEMIQKIGAHMDSNINFVNPYAEMYEHHNEYLFFKSDHHWTQRGAYYAYKTFCESIGDEVTPLDDFNYEIRNDSYSGSLYSWTNDARVKNFIDFIEVFEPTKSHTMTVTSSTGATYSYDTSIVPTNKTYVTFIAGDNPYTVINVPDNPQDKSILVLKDSFGNAFVPFLCQNYGNIIVVDVRYSNFNIYEQLKDYGLSDILFVNNVQAITASWAKMYLAAVGVN